MSNTLDLGNMQGRLLGNYLLLEELGKGNNGVVYLAKQQIFNRTVACKLLLPELAANPEYVENLLREARNAAKLDHPNVVHALDAGECDGFYYFVMEYVDGVTLEELRRNHPERLSLKFLLKIAIQLAAAMAYAWNRHQMIHGDIKPENLLITPNRQLKIADLGLARVSGGEAQDEIMATPMYVAPEVIMQENTAADPRSDIYSFGVMLYELTCGAPPFNGKTEDILRQHLDAIPVPLLQRNPDLDAELAHFIDSMLEKDPAARPQSWDETREKLKAICDRLFPVTPAAPAIRPPQDLAALSGNGSDFVPPENSKLSKYLLIAGVLTVLLASFFLIKKFNAF
ncbi:MAG: serine/threonine protein kinase [Lentisphaeria bacterium]|nr:serine/threonine protein kinase [Lentisphaeria bacterium]